MSKKPDASSQAASKAVGAQMQIDCAGTHLVDQEIQAIAESDEQIDRGESIDFDAFEAEMREKYCK